MELKVDKMEKDLRHENFACAFGPFSSKSKLQRKNRTEQNTGGGGV